MEESVQDEHVEPLGDRSHFRVSTRIRMVYETIEPGAREALAIAILGRIDPPDLEIDAGLVTWLDTIEHKLDRILHALNIGDRPLLCEEDEKNILISASGMSFAADHEIPHGAPVLLTFELPGTRRRMVRCIGEVVHCESKTDTASATIGVAFETIRPGDVDAISHFTFSVERQQLRAAHTPDGRHT